MNKLDSVSTYVIILFVVGLFATLITSYATDLLSNPNAELSENSQTYISEITGGDKKLGLDTNYTQEDMAKATDLGGDDNKNEFSLDFSFGDKSANRLTRTIYIALNIPSFILKDLFRLPIPLWFTDILDWLLRITLFIAGVNWIRGRKS